MNRLSILLTLLLFFLFAWSILYDWCCCGYYYHIIIIGRYLSFYYGRAYARALSIDSTTGDKQSTSFKIVPGLFQQRNPITNATIPSYSFQLFGNPNSYITWRTPSDGSCGALFGDILVEAVAAGSEKRATFDVPQFNAEGKLMKNH